jgi:hypothetical protein
MAYNKKNRYCRIIDIQNITLQYQAQGVTNEFIFKNYISPVYHISRDCFYGYLATNAKLKLKQLEEAEKQQPSLF